jgi:glycosyltransferase involved in cell wall biosynthesis
MNTPLISLITPTLNDLNNLKKLIKNIKKQKFRNFEHIVADGGSTDGTVEFLRNNNQVDKFFSSKDLNMYRGINKALELCEGRIIGYINADDQYNNIEYFRKIKECFQKNKVDCMYSGFELINSKNNQKKIFVPLKLKKRHLATLGMPFCQHSFFWSAKFKKQKFNLKYKVCSDFEFIGNIILKSKKIAYLQLNTSTFFKRKNSFGEKNNKKGIAETIEIKKYFYNKLKFNKFFFTFDRILNFINNFKKFDKKIHIIKLY